MGASHTVLYDAAGGAADCLQEPQLARVTSVCLVALAAALSASRASAASQDPSDDETGAGEL